MKAPNPQVFIGWLIEHNNERVEVELVNGNTYTGVLSIYDAESDHIRLNTDVAEGIPLAAIARVKPILKK